MDLFGNPVPDWCSFFGSAQYRRFMSLVRRTLEPRGTIHTIEDGMVSMTPAERVRPIQLGLQNLSQICNVEAERNWPSVIEGFVTNMMTTFDEQAALEVRAKDFGAVRDSLRIRLYGHVDPQFLERTVTRTLAGRLVATLVFDLPGSTMSVSSDYIERWGISPIDLFEIAKDNLAACDEGLRPSRMQLDEGGHIDVLGEDFFTASHLLSLEHLLDEPAPHGVLVIVPVRHAMAFHAIRDASVLPSINGLVGVAHNMFQDGPGSISPELYWWRDGELTLLPAELTETSMTFRPPADFVRVLNRVCDPLN